MCISSLLVMSCLIVVFVFGLVILYVCEMVVLVRGVLEWMVLFRMCFCSWVVIVFMMLMILRGVGGVLVVFIVLV